MRAVDFLGSRDTPILREHLFPVVPENVKVRPVPARLGRMWPRWAAAMTTPWAIYVRPDVLEGDEGFLSQIITHELVHARQWKTNGLMGFLRHYLTDYLRGRLRRLGHKDAYRSISLEAEAYDIAGKRSSRGTTGASLDGDS